VGVTDPIKLLLIDESRQDAQRIERALKRAGHTPVLSRIDNADALAQALDQGHWDVVLSEWQVPGLDLDQVQAMLIRCNLEAPLILVSGAISEEQGVKALRGRVRDYVSKDNLVRLVPALERAIKESATRRQRRQAEAALKDTEERYRTMLEASPDSIVVYDMHGRTTYVNHAFCQTFGWSADELAGKRIDFVPEQAIADTRRAVEGMLRGEPVHFFDTQRLTKDGRVLDIQLSSAVFHGRDGSPAGNIVILRDVTRQKAQEAERAAIQAQLRQSQKMEAIGTLAGGIAHDFNNILGVITGYNELALSKVYSGESPQEEISEVLVACERARQLIKQILTFSRGTREERRPIQVGTIAKEVVKLLRASLPSFIEIREDIACDHVIMGDPIEVHQLIMNLAANAGQAMRGRDGVLKISLHPASKETMAHPAFSDLPPGKYLDLTVSDTGPGIDPSIRERIFEPFFTTKGLGEGTGMGLAVVHGIVKSHGGGIRLESAPGHGASFSVLLPQVERESQEEPAADPAVPKGKQEKILLVDDEEDLVNIAKRFLESLGYQVTGMVSPSRALEIFHDKPDEFDLVITDQTMPGLSGMQLAEQIWAHRPGLPVVLCTGYSELVNPEQAKAQGISQFVMKPFIKAGLAHAVHNALSGRA
jgi:two-component system cell cycle sensor histidine kinase/response regulator CckA